MTDSDFNPHVTFQPDRLAPDVFVAHNATILGNVNVGTQSSIWFGAVLRGDTEIVTIGSQSNVQDLCVLHADPGYPCHIGDRVTIGHAAVVHGATVEDNTMIGMRAVILNGAQIGHGSLVAAGALVTERTVIPPHSVVMGMPAKVTRPTHSRITERIRHAAEHYAQMATRYRQAHGHATQ